MLLTCKLKGEVTSDYEGFHFYCSFANTVCCSLIFLFVHGRYEGRSKNVWESPKGCLLFSYTMQMEDGRVVPFVQYVVSLAMTEAIKDLCQQNVSAFS